jgi:hypothetical protein
MVIRNVPQSFTFEQQRQQINLIGNDLGDTSGLITPNNLNIVSAINQIYTSSSGIGSINNISGTSTGSDTYDSIYQTNTTGNGSGAIFSVTAVESDNTYTVSIISAGFGYAIGDTITISGDVLGGSTPANDLTFTITTIGLTGSGVGGNVSLAANTLLGNNTNSTANAFGLTVSQVQNLLGGNTPGSLLQLGIYSNIPDPITISTGQITGLADLIFGIVNNIVTDITLVNLENVTNSGTYYPVFASNIAGTFSSAGVNTSLTFNPDNGLLNSPQLSGILTNTFFDDSGALLPTWTTSTRPNGPGFGAFATFTIGGGIIQNLNIQNGGSGYVNGAVIIFSGAGSNASAILTVENGVVIGFTNFVGGTDYVNGTTTATIVGINYIGQTGYNTTLSSLETWNGVSWIVATSIPNYAPAYSFIGNIGSSSGTVTSISLSDTRNLLSGTTAGSLIKLDLGGVIPNGITIPHNQVTGLGNIATYNNVNLSIIQIPENQDNTGFSVGVLGNTTVGALGSSPRVISFSELQTELGGTTAGSLVQLDENGFIPSILIPSGLSSGSSSLPNISNNTILGNISGSTQTPQALTVTQIQNLLGGISQGSLIQLGRNSVIPNGITISGSQITGNITNVFVPANNITNGNFAGGTLTNSGLNNILLTTPVINSGVNFFGSSSGSIKLQALTTASGTLTLPNAIDTLIGKATTDILTNKTYDTAGIGNVLKINGTQVSNVTGSGSVVLSTNPSISTSLIASTTTFNLLNTTATTINFGGSATTINIGNSSGNVVVTGNLNFNSETFNITDSNGTQYALTVDTFGNLYINGKKLAFVQSI